MFWIQFLILLICIFIGARIGGLGLGVMGGVGLAIFVFLFGLEPTSAPIDVMLMILSVITAAGALQAAGGMEYLVHIAEKALRKILNGLHSSLLSLLTFLLFVQELDTLHTPFYLLLPK